MSLFCKMFFLSIKTVAVKTETPIKSLDETWGQNPYITIALAILFFITFILILLYLAIRSRRLNEYGAIRPYSTPLRKNDLDRKTFIEITFPENEEEVPIQSDLNINPQINTFITTEKMVGTCTELQLYTLPQISVHNLNCTKLILYKAPQLIDFEVQLIFIKFIKSNCTALQIYKAPKRMYYNPQPTVKKTNCTALRFYKLPQRMNFRPQLIFMKFIKSNCTALQLYTKVVPPKDIKQSNILSKDKGKMKIK